MKQTRRKFLGTTSATGAGLQMCIDHTGPEATIVELSWYGIRPVELELGATFHLDRKQLISSQVSTLPAHKSGRWDPHRRKQLVFELLKDPAWDALITTEIELADAPAFFDKLRAGNDAHGLGVVIRYDK